MTTTDYLDALKKHFSIESDYALAKHWDISRQKISQYRRKQHFLSDERALEIAETLNLDPAEVLANVYAERTNCPAVRKVWEKAAKRLSTAACVCFALIFSGIPDTADASDKHFKQSNNIYYAHLIIARIFWLICSFMGLDLTRPKTTL